MRSVTSFIDEVVNQVPGWTPPDQLLSLYTLAIASAELKGDVVELGSWCGRSTVVLATAVRETHGLVHAVDLFPEWSDWKQNEDGSFSFEVTLDSGRRLGGYADQTVWAEPFEQAIRPVYEKFGSVRAAFDHALSEFGVIDYVRTHRSDSTVIPELNDLAIRLGFIDGDHSFDSVCLDIRNFISRLQPLGWITFDDAFSFYEGVDRAIMELVVGSNDFSVKSQLTRKFFAAQRRP